MQQPSQDQMRALESLKGIPWRSPRKSLTIRAGDACTPSPFWTISRLKLPIPTEYVGSISTGFKHHIMRVIISTAAAKACPMTAEQEIPSGLLCLAKRSCVIAQLVRDVSRSVELRSLVLYAASYWALRPFTLSGLETETHRLLPVPALRPLSLTPL